MAGHRDDGTFAEDKAHHPNRKIQKPWSLSDVEKYGHPSYPRLSGHMSRLFNISPMDAAGVIDMHKNKQALGDAGYEGAAPEDYELTRKLGTDSPTEAIQDTIRGRRKKSGSLDNTDYTPRTDPYGRGI